VDDEREVKTVKETVAGNVRTFRQLRGLDQGTLALRLDSLGIPWRQATVSEVEHERRNVTVAELLVLAFVLETTIEQLLDPRGPERIRGPWLSFSDSETAPSQARLGPGPEEANRGTIEAFPPQWVTGLVCTHVGHHEVEWGDDGKVKSLWFEKNEWFEKAQPR
jgi:transcriptional regulator with XRE-family HTH domain